MRRFAFVLTCVLAVTLPAFATSTSRQDPLSKKQLAALVATARTPADHQRIAVFYRAQSEKLRLESAQHAAMAAAFRANPATNNRKSEFGTVHHCEYLAHSLNVRAEKALALAQEHEQMAQASEPK